jgi:hypothetical protein
LLNELFAGYSDVVYNLNFTLVKFREPTKESAAQ